jgi:YVTN family beta-propeller protein
LSADGKTAYVTNGNDGTVTVIDTATQATQTIGVGSNPMGVAISPDGTTIYVTNGYSNSLSVIDAATNTVVNTIDLGGGAFAPVSVTVSADGSKVYVGRASFDGSSSGDVVVLPATALSPVV